MSSPIAAKFIYAFLQLVVESKSWVIQKSLKLFKRLHKEFNYLIKHAKYLIPNLVDNKQIRN